MIWKKLFWVHQKSPISPTPLLLKFPDSIAMPSAVAQCSVCRTILMILGLEAALGFLFLAEGWDKQNGDSGLIGRPWETPRAQLGSDQRTELMGQKNNEGYRSFCCVVHVHIGLIRLIIQDISEVNCTP